MKTYDELTELFNQVQRQSFPYKAKDISRNGIYIMFEKGEQHKNLNRIVRIGSHTGEGRLFERIDEHYIGEDHRDSIFRKHLGRCFLTADKRTDYIKNWDLKIKTREDKLKNANQIKWDIEEKYEQKITDYIKSSFSFIVIPNIDNEVNRIRLEKALIATFAQHTEKTVSNNWLGKYHPNTKISVTGLWNIQHIKGTPLNEVEIKFIKKQLV